MVNLFRNGSSTGSNCITPNRCNQNFLVWKLQILKNGMNKYRHSPRGAKPGSNNKLLERMHTYIVAMQHSNKCLGCSAIFHIFYCRPDNFIKLCSQGIKSLLKHGTIISADNICQQAISTSPWKGIGETRRRHNITAGREISQSKAARNLVWGSVIKLVWY